MYEYLKCTKVDPMTFDILTGTRNNTETINNLFSYKIPGSLSNRLKVYIKNGNLLEADANKIAEVLTQQIGTYLPMNITNVDYDFSIGNRISKIITKDVVEGVITDGDITGIFRPEGTTRAEGTLGPIFDFMINEAQVPIFTQEGKYIYYDF